MRSVILTSFFLLGLSPLASFADDKRDDLVIYQVQNRSADELAALARKMFGERAGFAADNGRIIINGPRETNRAAVKLLRELDRLPARFRIQLRELAGGESERESLSSAFSVALSGHRAQLAKRSVTFGSGRVESSGQNDQTVDVVEGGQATLIAGDSAFRVSARPAGKGAALVNIEQITGREYGGSTSGLVTELSVPEGQWQSIAGSDSKSQSKQTGLLSRASQKAAANRNWQIRVESVKP